jgi:hypothetical protein
MRIKFATLAVLATVALSGPAYAVLIAAEEAIETSTLGISLPANAQGVIVAKLCPTCEVSVLRVTAETRFLVGKTAVSLAELQKYVATTSAHGMVVLYDPRVHTVTRIIVKGELPAAKR